MERKIETNPMYNANAIQSILIDIGHPFHYHVFKSIIESDVFHDFDFLITARNKDITDKLLNINGVKYFDRGKGQKTLLGKLLYLLRAIY